MCGLFAGADIRFEFCSCNNEMQFVFLVARLVSCKQSYLQFLKL